MKNMVVCGRFREKRKLEVRSRRMRERCISEKVSVDIHKYR